MQQLALRVVRSPDARLVICHAFPHQRRLRPSSRRFSQSPPKLEDSGPKAKVKWYQQLFPWSKERTPVDSSNPDADDVMLQEAKRVKKHIDRLEDELYEMRREGTEGTKALYEPILEKLPEKDRREARVQIKRIQLEEEEKARELARFLPRLEIKWELPPMHNSHLRKLNSKIRDAVEHTGSYTLRRKLWLSYARCKAFLPPFTHLIPDSAWAVLWKAQLVASMREDPHWPKHLLALVADMQAAGKKLEPPQILLQIEAFRADGRTDEAISRWQDLGKTIENDKQASVEHELLGVRLFTSQNNPTRAEQIASWYLENDSQGDARILIPLIRAWTERRDDTGMKHAWALYLRLRMQLGSDITMEDYDNVSIAFLNGGRADVSLAVFKDLMLTGQQTSEESVELYKRSQNFLEKAHLTATTMEELKEIPITALTTIPRRFQNKYFYASWLKKLIGMGHPDAAEAVINLMYQRGVQPDTKYLNGLIAAWFRKRTDIDKAKAEKLGWALIHRRIDVVSENLRGPSPHSGHMGTRELHIFRNGANVETFCVLLQDYTRRGQYEKARKLEETLAMAKIIQDRVWVNEMLFMELRCRHPQRVWDRYRETLQTMRPDLDTFKCLWACAKVMLDPRTSVPANHFPMPRMLMREMISWSSNLSEKERTVNHEDFTQALYNEIIHSVCQSKDLPGVLVALYTLRDHFGFYPDDETASTISRQVASVGFHRNKRGQWSRTKRKQRDVRAAKANEVFQIVQQERTEALIDHGFDDPDQLTEEVQSEERLYIAAQFVQKILQTRFPSERDREAGIAKAASEMGVDEIRMEDPLSYQRR